MDKLVFNRFFPKFASFLSLFKTESASKFHELSTVPHFFLSLLLFLRNHADR